MTSIRVLGRHLAEILGAGLLGSAVGVVVLLGVNQTSFEHPSHLPRIAMATLSALLVLAVAYLLLRRSPVGSRMLWGAGVVTPAALAGMHLGFVLHGTPHYFFGIQGDQLNRVPLMGRFADSAANQDVFYADTAPFYPAGWFWVGGRLADLLGIPAWEFYKTFSIATMAAAGAMAFVAWRWVIEPRLGVVVALVTTMVGLHLNAYEPYSWLLIAVLPVVVVGVLAVCAGLGGRRGLGDRGDLDDRADLGDRRDSGVPWALTVGIGLYLGWAALSYTLIAGFAAAVVGGLVLASAWRMWRRGDGRAAATALLHLVAMAGISAVLALVFWWRYLAALVGDVETESSVASDFAPLSSAEWPLPMLETSALGILCLLGVCWLVLRLWPAGGGADAWSGGAPDAAGDGALGAPFGEQRLDLVAKALAAVTVGVLAWFLVSGLRAFAGSTLLPFRLEPVLTNAVAVAGVFGAVALTRWVLSLDAIAAQRRPAVRAAAVVIALAASIQLVQHVSGENRDFADAARAMPAPPEDVLAALDEAVPPAEASENVLLTDVPSILAYRPFASFQAPAQAYASPAGRYEARADEITRWADARSAAELDELLESSEFRAPDMFLLTVPEGPEASDGAGTGSGSDGAGYFEYTRVDNTMPRTGNIARTPLRFDREVFDDPALFEVREVGNRVVIERR